MVSLKYLFAVLLFCGMAGAACTSPCIQSKSCTGTASPLACAYASNPTAGSLLTAWVMVGIASTTAGASDSLNGTFTAAGAGQACGSSGACFGEMFYWCSSGTGADTVTATATGTVGQLQVIIEEWSGIVSSACLDQQAYTGNTVSTTQVTPNLTDGQATDLIIAAEANAGNGGTKSVASPYTITGATTTSKMADGWQTVSSTSVTGATFTFQFSAVAAVGTFSFKQTGGAAAVQCTLSLMGAGPC